MGSSPSKSSSDSSSSSSDNKNGGTTVSFTPALVRELAGVPSTSRPVQQQQPNQQPNQQQQPEPIKPILPQQQQPPPQPQPQPTSSPLPKPPLSSSPVPPPNKQLVEKTIKGIEKEKIISKKTIDLINKLEKNALVKQHNSNNSNNNRINIQCDISPLTSCLQQQRKMMISQEQPFDVSPCFVALRLYEACMYGNTPISSTAMGGNKT
jgi:hypothetical protein